MSKKAAGKEAGRTGWRAPARYAGAALGLVAMAAAAFAGYYRARQFLVDHAEFRLAGASGMSGDIPTLQIEGVVHVSKQRVVEAFANDYGRSVYLIPLRERRRNLLAIDWVKDATVCRLWPNRLVVRIQERTPVAFVQLPASRTPGAYETALIDADGVILDPPARTRFTLPLLTGIRREQSVATRRECVRAAMRLIQELGAMTDQISEIDAGDPQNLKVTHAIGSRAVVLFLGRENFLRRLRNFLDHYPEIQKRLANATVFDLRLDDRITAVRQEGVGG